MFKNLIIADDFTGANDTGMQLRRRGYRTKVLLKKPDDNHEDISYVIDTESRGLCQEDAYQKIKSCITGIELSEYKYMIKKVDSTLRGNVAWEIKAADEVYGSELVVFMPALPDLNRTTVNGVHMLKGVPITKTEIAKDPVKPVTEDHIQRLLQTVYEETVTHISLGDIEAGNIDFSVGRIFAIDAVTNEQMQTVVEKVKETGKKTLYVGTAAMADNIFELETATVPAMGLIASVSEVTNKQIKYAQDYGIALVQVSMPELLNHETTVDGYVAAAKKVLDQKKDVLVLSSASYDREELNKTVATAMRKGMSREETSWWTQSKMGEIGKKILNAVQLSGIFLTGGDTAIGFLDMLGTDGAEIVGEIATGVPMLRLTGNHFDGLKLVTKAGAFGNQDAIVYSLRKLKEQL